MEKRALVVDDDSTIREVVQAILEGAGFEVATAVHGRAAVERLEASSPDQFSIIVLDVMMPELNGFEVLQSIKSNEKTQSIPVIMLTAEDRTEDLMNGYSRGADYYITKPFTRQQLLYGLQLVLGEKVVGA